MTIADLIKYIDSLKERKDLTFRKLSQAEMVKETHQIIATGTDMSTYKFSYPQVSVSDLMSEYDKVCKELRLAQQELERANHTTKVELEPAY